LAWLCKLPAGAVGKIAIDCGTAADDGTSKRFAVAKSLEGVPPDVKPLLGLGGKIHLRQGIGECWCNACSIHLFEFSLIPRSSWLIFRAAITGIVPL